MLGLLAVQCTIYFGSLLGFCVLAHGDQERPQGAGVRPAVSPASEGCQTEESFQTLNPFLHVRSKSRLLEPDPERTRFLFKFKEIGRLVISEMEREI